MKVCIECYRKDGSQILGNLDGQCVIDAKDYKRTLKYKKAKGLIKNPKHMNSLVDKIKVVHYSSGILLEELT